MKLNKFSKKIVLFVVIANCLFTACMIGVFFVVRAEPTTLIISWFGFTSTELLALAGIKYSKIKNGDKDAD